MFPVTVYLFQIDTSLVLSKSMEYDVLHLISLQMG